MKKVIGVAAFAIFGMVALSSCKKVYTCTCTTTSGSYSYTSTSTYTATKSDATTLCEADNDTYTTCTID